MYNQVKARAIWTFTLFHPFYKTEGAVLPNVFQNGFSSSRGAALSEEPEPEPFSEEPVPCQTGHFSMPTNHTFQFFFFV